MTTMDADHLDAIRARTTTRCNTLSTYQAHYVEDVTALLDQHEADQQRIAALEADNLRLTMNKAQLIEDVKNAAQNCRLYRNIEKLAIRDRGAARRRVKALEAALKIAVEALESEGYTAVVERVQAALKEVDDASA